MIDGLKVLASEGSWHNTAIWYESELKIFSSDGSSYVGTSSVHTVMSSLVV